MFTELQWASEIKQINKTKRSEYRLPPDSANSSSPPDLKWRQIASSLPYDVGPDFINDIGMMSSGDDLAGVCWI